MTTAAETKGLAPGDLAQIRADFPILDRRIGEESLAYLDNSATAQTPTQVIGAMDDYYREHNANVHRGVHTLSEEATALYEGARETVARFIGAGRREVIFTRNATAAINLAVQSWAELELGPGDLVALTEMEHHSNIVPWYLAARRAGARIEWIAVDDDGRIDLDSFREILSERPKGVGITHVSNVLGTLNPVAEMVAEARAAGAMTLIDGAQATPRVRVDVNAIGADFYAFTGHKLYGPTGIGVLHGRPEMLERIEPFEGGGSMISRVGRERITWAEPPAKFEAGTPMIAEAVGLGRAIEWIEATGIEVIAGQEKALLEYALRGLSEVPGIRLFGPRGSADREGIISFELDGVHPHDVSEILDRHGVAVRAGHHCAQILMDRLEVPALTRASFAVYNSTDEVDRLVDGLLDCRRVFGL
jgi:cysteine desulfurase/selenocysteine lyase